MAGIYSIGSKLGYDLANGMKIGDTITATDGSVWTKNADGGITVQQGGKTYTGQITYQPQRQTSPGAQGPQTGYSQQLQDTIKELQNASWEGWDKNSDPSYQALRKEYLREADRTMDDTLARYAQNTGGIAGSQAIAAASQAADYQKAKLSDAIPTLHDNAYSRWLGNLQQKQNAANLMLNAENQAQSQYYNQLNYAMNKWAQMGYADGEVAAILGVAQGTPTSDQSYSDWAKAFDERKYSASTAGNRNGTTPTDGNPVYEEQPVAALLETDIASLKQMYPDGMIPADVWDGLVSGGVSKVALANAGFSRQQGGDEFIAQAAANYLNVFGDEAYNPDNLARWLNDRGYTGETAELFKAYLYQYAK
jgi:hypothetical protein